MFGEKLFTGVGFPTPVDIPVDTTCLIVNVPASDEWWALVTGLFYELTLEWNWQQYEGGLDRDVAASAWHEMFNEAFDLAAQSNQCTALVPAPYWDDSDGADADDELAANAQDWYGVLVGEATWQEQIEDWFIAAFVAMAATPAAAISFLTIAPKFRLAWKTANWGAIVNIFLDATQIDTVDTYSATPGIVTLDVTVPTGMGMANGAHELWVVHSGEHNVAATPDTNGDYTIQVIRKRLSVEEFGVTTIFRQNPADACQLQQSIDDGANWTLAFDYGLCVTPSVALILQLVGGQTQPVNPAAPTETWVSQDGDGDTEREARTQALCYAANAIVAQMADTALEIINGNLTLTTLSAIALGLAGTIAGLFVSAATGGAFLPLGLAIASAALAAASVIAAAGAGVFEDTAVRDALACALLQNIMNKGVSLATFQTAFDGACFTGDTAIVAGIFSDMLSDPVNGQGIYDSFLNMLGNASGAALQGTLAASCVCDATDWCYVVDLTDGLGIFTLVSGTWQEGVGVTMAAVSHTTYIDCADTIGVTHAIELTADVYFPADVGLGDPALNHLGITIDVPTEEFSLTRIDANADCQAQTGVNIGAAGYNPAITGQQKITIIATNNTGGLVLGTSTFVTLRGQGFNPFAVCDNC